MKTQPQLFFFLPALWTVFKHTRDDEGLKVYLIHTHTHSAHIVMMTKPDFLEKNETVAGGLPLASPCVLIYVTFNMVLHLFSHFFSFEVVNAPVCVVAHFSCPDTGHSQIPLKASIVSLSASQLMSIASGKGREKESGSKEKKGEDSWSQGEGSETWIWGSFCFREEEVNFMAVTLSTLLVHISVMNM